MNSNKTMLVREIGLSCWGCFVGADDDFVLVPGCPTCSEHGFDPWHDAVDDYVVLRWIQKEAEFSTRHFFHKNLMSVLESRYDPDALEVLKKLNKFDSSWTWMSHYTVGDYADALIAALKEVLYGKED